MKIDFPPFLLVHMSSRWDRSPASLKRQLKRAAKAGASIITMTEVADGKRPQAVALPGWSKAQGGQEKGRFDLGESAILTDDSVWEILHWRAYVIGPDLGPGNRITLIMALLRNQETDQTVVVSVCHLPSAVQQAWTEARGTHFREATDRWRRINKAWRRKFNPDDEWIIADWNLDFHQDWVRVAVRSMFPEHRAPLRLPTLGTHGRRLIDMVLTRRLRGLHLRVRSSNGASDHHELWIENK